MWPSSSRRPTRPTDPPRRRSPSSTEPATEVAVEDLTAGDGAALEAGTTGVVHLAAAQGDTGETAEEHVGGWAAATGRARPLTSSCEGLVEGLEGMQVGGRRAVTIPFASLNEQVVADLGLPANTDLVVIVDLAAVL